MRAAVCREFGKPLVIEDVSIAAPGAEEVAVDVRACAICHSDISYWQGDWGGALPAVYGHEAAGIVIAVGPGAGSVKVGDHVVVTLIRSCGTCVYCGEGSQVICETEFALDREGPIHGSQGEDIFQAMRTGGFAEKVVVHQSQIVKIPDEIPFASASLLACGVITGFGAVVNTAHLRPGQDVAVIGCGGVGINSIQGAAHAGARNIVAIDITDEKLELAKGFGATHGINPLKGDPAAEIMELTNGRGVNFVFVTVGASVAFEQAADYITKNGSIIVVGMPPTGVYSRFDPGTMAAWNQKITGSKMGEAVISRDIPILVDAYLEGRLKLDDLVSNTYPLEAINEAIAEVKSGKVIRNVIVFD